MSKNSTKQRVTQLMEWLPTLSSKRKKRVKSNDTRQRVNEGFESSIHASSGKTTNISSRDVRIKNGPNGRR